MKKLVRPLGATAALSLSGLVSGLVACGGAAVGPGGADLSGNERDVTITHEACNGDSSGAKKVDVNKDGKPDITHVMSGGRETCRIVDLNFDGRVDAFIYFDSAGKERRRESDFDRDGRADEIAIYQGGTLVQKLRETNFDGKIDTWDTYAGAKLVRRERDSDADAIIDQWWEFNSDDPRCAMVSSDKNTDGKPDPDTIVDLCADPNAPVKPQAPAGEPSASASAATSAAPAPSASAPPPSSAAPSATPPAASSTVPPKPPPAAPPAPAASAPKAPAPPKAP
jgi:hypothetical protein